MFYLRFVNCCDWLVIARDEINKPNKQTLTSVSRSIYVNDAFVVKIDKATLQPIPMLSSIGTTKSNIVDDGQFDWKSVLMRKKPIELRISVLVTLAPFHVRCMVVLTNSRPRVLQHKIPSQLICCIVRVVVEVFLILIARFAELIQDTAPHKHGRHGDR